MSEAVDEVEKNALRIWQLTGRRPHFYRSSTTYADEFGVKIVQELGYQMVSFSVDGDGGASFSKQTIMKQLLSAPNGSIILLHFNHPEKEGAEGLISALPILQARGVRFGKLQEVKKPNP